MNLIELKDKLYWNNVPERWYSLNDGLKPDACILYKNYSIWEFFYLDEKGGRHDNKIFDKDEDAYKYLWGKMKYQLQIFNVEPRKEES
jgi:hypothetical protein